MLAGQPEDRAMQGCNPSAELEAGAGGPWKHGRHLPFLEIMKVDLVMTVTIDFPPDIEAGLFAQARAQGIDVADYVRNLVRKDVAANVHIESQSAHPVKKRKRLSELFSVLQGNDIDLSRNPSTGRPVNL
jgi:hypothetical protein